MAAARQEPGHVDQRVYREGKDGGFNGGLYVDGTLHARGTGETSASG